MYEGEKRSILYRFAFHKEKVFAIGITTLLSVYFIWSPFSVNILPEYIYVTIPEDLILSKDQKPIREKAFLTYLSTTVLGCKRNNIVGVRHIYWLDIYY